MKIVQVLPEDRNGGAYRVPMYLHYAYKNHGFESVIFVGEKHTEEPDIVEMKSERSKWAKLFLILEEALSKLNFRGIWRIKEIIRFFGQPKRQLKIWLGYEDFEFPGTKILLDFLQKEKFDILNLHVLHGFWLKDRGFFDLRLLPEITKIIPTVFTLHDMWLMTGHCSHSLGCDRWKIGCGKCPDITLPPAIRRDLSHINWKVKKEIYSKSKYWCIAPSYWMARICEESILRYGLVELKVIYNGIDREVFKPVSDEERETLRKEFGIPLEKFVLICAAKSIRTNRWKGFDILIKALKEISDKDIIVVALGGVGYGEKHILENIGNIKIIYAPFESDHRIVSKYLAVSDVFVLSSRAETMPLSVLEASSCGAVPIASKIGPIPEIIEDGVNGLLFASEDYIELSKKILLLYNNREVLKNLKQNAIANSKRFDIKLQVEKYIEFFQEIRDSFGF